jgi:alpha-beta hydrolase superfamily lysophospholipase
MSWKWKRRLLVLLGLVLVGFALLNLLAYRHAHAMMYFTANGSRTRQAEDLGLADKIGVLFSGIKLPRPESGITLASLGPAWKGMTIACTNGVRLGAWQCGGARPDQLVILFHGYDAEKSSLLNEANAFLEMGFSVLLVDFRGSGESSESYTTIGFREGEDVAASVRYAREHLSTSRIVLYGESMGAAAILRAVHSEGVRPDAIILEAVFDRLLTTAQNRFAIMGLPSFPAAQLLIFWGGWQAGFNGFSHNPIDYAASVQCPVLFLHGTDDPRAKLQDARRVFAAVTTMKTFKEFQGMGHRGGLGAFPAEWKEAVSNFLK